MNYIMPKTDAKVSMPKIKYMSTDITKIKPEFKINQKVYWFDSYCKKTFEGIVTQININIEISKYRENKKIEYVYTIEYFYNTDNRPITTIKRFSSKWDNNLFASRKEVRDYLFNKKYKEYN